LPLVLSLGTTEKSLAPCDGDGQRTLPRQRSWAPEEHPSCPQGGHRLVTPVKPPKTASVFCSRCHVALQEGFLRLPDAVVNDPPTAKPASGCEHDVALMARRNSAGCRDFCPG